MADPKDYVLVRMDDNIRDGAVLTYDGVNDKITDSGMLSSQGELQAAAGTVSVGLQDMSSVGEQVMWRNQVSGVCYAPPWHIIDEVGPGGSRDRLYEPMQTVTRFADRSVELENPRFQVHVPVNEVVFSLNITFVEANHDVVLEVLSAGKQMWREIISTNQGASDYVLAEPIAFYPGDYEFQVRPYGDINLEPPIKVMGNGTTGEMGYDVTFREFREIPLATQEYVLAAVTGGTADDVMLKSHYDPNNNGVVDGAEAIQGAVTAGRDKYYGTDANGIVGFHDITLHTPSFTNLQSQVTDNLHAIVANTKGIEKATTDLTAHEKAIEGHGTQLADHANKISTNTNNIKVALDYSKGAMDEGTQNRKNAVNALVAEVDSTHKSITLKLMSTAGVVDAALIDLSSWFPSTPPQPNNDHVVYYGFSVNPPLDEAEILRVGTRKELPTIADADITVTRSDNIPSYIWVWLPDTLGVVKGFDFSGFVSQWTSTVVNVSGIKGKFYYSPNKTSAQSVEFEVRI